MRNVTDLVLKVRRRRRKRRGEVEEVDEEEKESGGDWEYSAEVLGVVETSFEFTGWCDN